MKKTVASIKLLFVLVVVACLVATSYTKADATCCERPGAGGACADGYKPGTGKCCGVGKCNVFCCHCKGGCRKGPDNRQGCYDKCDAAHSVCSSGCTIACTGAPSDSCDILCDAKCATERDECKSGCDKKYPSSESAEHECFTTFNAHDANHDGHLSKEEFGALVKKNNLNIDANKEFDEMDTNKDGLISHDEAGITLPTVIKEKINSKKKK